MDLFVDRVDAGYRLALRLQRYHGQSNVTVLGLVRGGVPVADEVARRIDAPLEALIVCKLGVPNNPELAIGALASGGVRVLNKDIIMANGVTEDYIESITKRETEHLEKKAARLGGTTTSLSGRTAILIDDGIATGATMLAAAQAVRARGAIRVVVAAPAVARDAGDHIRRAVDELVAVLELERFYSVSKWYLHFGQVSETEVRRLLAEETARRT